VIGSKGTLFTRDWHGGEKEEDMFLLLPRKNFEGYQPPPPSLSRPGHHHKEWIRACKDGSPTGSNFAYASRLTEPMLLGNLALRAGGGIVWDVNKIIASNCPAADSFMRPRFR